MSGRPYGKPRGNPVVQRPIGARRDRLRPAVLSVRLNAHTKRELQAAAMAEGLTASEWVRRLVDGALTRPPAGS
jgi:hypothetical protein